MSTLQFFDLFRAFVGEIENRNLHEDQRQRMYDATVASLKDILAAGPVNASFGPGLPGAVQTPNLQAQARPQQQQQQHHYQQQQVQPPPQAAPPAQQQQQHQAHQAQQQQAHQAQQQQQQQTQSAGGVPTMKPNDPASRAMLRAMNEAAYAANAKLPNTYKNMCGNSDSLTAESMSAGFARLGVHCSAADMGVIIAPYAKNGELNYGAFVRMLGNA